MQSTDSNTTAQKQRVDSDKLLPKGELLIRHNNEDYLLRVTKSGKLLLTK